MGECYELARQRQRRVAHLYLSRPVLTLGMTSREFIDIKL